MAHLHAKHRSVHALVAPPQRPRTPEGLQPYHSRDAALDCSKGACQGAPLKPPLYCATELCSRLPALQICTGSPCIQIIPFDYHWGSLLYFLGY